MLGSILSRHGRTLRRTRKKLRHNGMSTVLAGFTAPPEPQDACRALPQSRGMTAFAKFSRPHSERRTGLRESRSTPLQANAAEPRPAEAESRGTVINVRPGEGIRIEQTRRASVCQRRWWGLSSSFSSSRNLGRANLATLWARAARPAKGRIRGAGQPVRPVGAPCIRISDTLGLARHCRCNEIQTECRKTLQLRSRIEKTWPSLAARAMGCARVCYDGAHRRRVGVALDLLL